MNELLTYDFIIIMSILYIFGILIPSTQHSEVDFL